MQYLPVSHLSCPLSERVVVASPAPLQEQRNILALAVGLPGISAIRAVLNWAPVQAHATSHKVGHTWQGAIIGLVALLPCQPCRCRLLFPTCLVAETLMYLLICRLQLLWYVMHCCDAE